MTASLLSTWDLLRSIGFEQDPTVMSDPPGGLSYDFGNVRISAAHGIDRRFKPAVLFSGYLVTPRIFAEIHCEVPVAFPSRELGLAWITACLDKSVSPKFEPALATPWLAEGRQYRHLLPWEKRLAAYAARPYCLVSRDWVRIAFRELRQSLAAADAGAMITFQFDGEVLKIRGAGSAIAMPASGQAWPNCFAVPARDLQPLPKRLMRDPIEFGVFDSKLKIGNVQYSGVIQLDPVQ